MRWLMLVPFRSRGPGSWRPGSEAEREHVGPLEQALGDRPPLGRFEIDRDALLALEHLDGARLRIS